MTGDKIAKQLERDALAYKQGFADGYRAGTNEVKQLEKKLEEYARTLAEVDPVSAAALARRWRES